VILPPNPPPLHPPTVRRDSFSPGLLTADAAVFAWLGWAFCRFRGCPAPHAIWFCGGSLALAGIAWVVLGHRPPIASWRQWLVRPAVLACALALGLLFTLAAGPILTVAACTWLGVTAVMLLIALRIAWWAARVQLSETRWELARWIPLGALAVWLVHPYYHDGDIGGGPAHWYGLMLADFV